MRKASPFHTLTKRLIFLLSMFTLSVTSVMASQFNVGETVFVAFPAGNIKDDAFIVGKITKRTEKGDYQIAVLDYVEGHDYGSSCVPISKHTQDQGLGTGWELWQDTTKLDTQRLEYIVSKNSVMPLEVGKHYFVERNNVYIVFGRWKSDAPMLTVDRIDRVIREAKNAGLKEMIPAFELVKLHRESYYGEYGRPLMAFETIEPLNRALEGVLNVFAQSPKLEAIWRSKQRDWQAISKSTHDYFLIDAIDKIVADAKDQLYADGVENADPQILESFKQKIEKLQRSK